MSISSINTSIGSAAQSPQAPNLLNNAPAAGSAVQLATSTSSSSSNTKLNSDWLKIKVAAPTQQPLLVHDESGKEPGEKLKIPTTAGQISQTASNYVKHKIVSKASTTKSSGSIQIQVPSTLTLSGPKNIIKSTTPASPTTTTLNLTQLTTKKQSKTGTTSPGITVLPSDGPVIKAFSLSNNPTIQNAEHVNIGTLNIPNPRKVNIASSKITLQGSSGSSANSNTINNLVKNILSSGTSNNAAIANATAAVTAAATTYSQMNNESNSVPKIVTKNAANNNSNHPIITTLMQNNSEGSKNEQHQAGGSNNASSNQVHQITKLQGSSNQINLPSTTLNLSTSQAAGQLPKITVLTALNNSNATTVSKGIKQPQGRVITATTTTTAATSSPTMDTSNSTSNITKTTIPISLKASTAQPSHHAQLIPISSSSNGQISNIVSGINLRTLSPISFSLPANTNDVNTKINTKTTTQNSTTPPPSGIQNQPLTINATNISNLISKSIANNLMNTTSISNQGNVYRTIPQSQQPCTTQLDNDEQQQQQSTTYNNKPINNFTNTNSQTIAQICSNLNNQYQIQQQQGNNNNASTTIQPIRYINNSQPTHHNHHHHQHHQQAKIYQQNTSNSQSVHLQQFTLNNSMLSHGNSSSIKKSLGNNNNNLVSNASLPQSSSSPSASPLKPNIIRKPRRDSPSHANLNNITLNSTDQQHQVLNMYHQPSLKHPIYELTQTAMMDTTTTTTTNAKNPVTVQLLNQMDQLQQTPSENLYQHQAQILSIPSSSSPSSSSTMPSSSSSSSSNPKSIVNLIAESSSSLSSTSSSSSSDVSKNIRKYTLNTQLNLPSVQQVNVRDTQPKESWATASTLASSSSSSSSPIPNKPLQQQQQQTDLPSSSAQPTSSTSLPQSSQPIEQSQPELTTSRKRRKQEFKKISEDHSISYNSNPLSNNSALAYSMIKTGKLEIDKQLLDNLEGIDDTVNDELITARFTKKIRSNLYQNCSDQTPIAVPISNQTEKIMQLNAEEQMLVNEVKTNSNESDDSNDCLDDETVQLLSKEFSYVASNGVKWTSKRNRSHISKSYKSSWKPRSNHYLRYSDVKLKEKVKKPTVKTITHKELIENLNEWKFHFVISQVKNLITFENESLTVIDDVENLMQNNDFFDSYSDITIKINESIKANSQRHKHVNEQLDEAQQLINELFDHKEKFKSSILMSSSSTSSKNSSSESSNSIKMLQNSSNKNQQPSSHMSLKSINNNSNKNHFSSSSSSKKGISTRSSQLKNSSPISNIINKSAKVSKS